MKMKNPPVITNEMLNTKLDLVLQILEQHEKRFDQIDKRLDQMDRRLDQMDKRFEQIDKRFEQIDRRLDKIDNRLERLEYRVDDIYDSRDKVSVKFIRSWMFASLGITFLSVTLALAVNKMI
jgi:chromosome segregation ATPase